jgi:hypothetical protein
MIVKIQALQHDWTSPVFAKKVLPLLLQNDLAVVKSKTLFLNDVYLEDYFISMQVETPVLSVLDCCHWHYPDEAFDRYLRRIASFNLPAVCFGESPFGFERPFSELYTFEEQLYKRTKMLFDTFRLHSPSTQLVSPGISLVSPELQDHYLDYFIHNRRYFDIYAVHCTYDLKEQTLGLLTAFLNQVLQVLRKPVWVTQWAVPACDHSVVNPMSITPLDWQPITQVQAAYQLRAGFLAIEEIAGPQTRWFFTGIDRDEYTTIGKVPNMWDGYAYRANPVDSSSWSYRNFLGAVDYNGVVKSIVLDSLFQLLKNA